MLPNVTPWVSTQKKPACSSTISARNQPREELKAWSGGKAFSVVADIDCSPRYPGFITTMFRGRVGRRSRVAGSADGSANDPQGESAPRRRGEALCSFRRAAPGSKCALALSKQPSDRGAAIASLLSTSPISWRSSLMPGVEARAEEAQIRPERSAATCPGFTSRYVRDSQPRARRVDPVLAEEVGHALEVGVPELQTDQPHDVAAHRPAPERGHVLRRGEERIVRDSLVLDLLDGMPLPQAQDFRRTRRASAPFRSAANAP